MGDDSAAVVDEFLGFHGALGLLGLDTQNFKIGNCVVLRRADGGAAAVVIYFSRVAWSGSCRGIGFQQSTLQRQAVVGVCAVTTVKSCMDGIDGLLHLIGTALLSGSLGKRHGSAVQQPLVCGFVDI